MKCDFHLWKKYVCVYLNLIQLKKRVKLYAYEIRASDCCPAAKGDIKNVISMLTAAAESIWTEIEKVLKRKINRTPQGYGTSCSGSIRHWSKTIAIAVFDIGLQRLHWFDDNRTRRVVIVMQQTAVFPFANHSITPGYILTKNWQWSITPQPIAVYSPHPSL